MLAVGFEVEKVVDDVGGGGTEAEAEERQDNSGEDPWRPCVREEHDNEDEGVFCPLVQPDCLEPRFEGGSAFDEGADRGDAGLAEGGTEAGCGVGDHGLLTVLEEREVGESVADVGEVVAKAGLKGGQLGVAGEVELAIGGEDAGEDAKVRGDAVGGVGICGCGEIDGTAGGALLLKILEEFAVVGQMGYVELDGSSEVALEGCLALD